MTCSLCRTNQTLSLSLLTRKMVDENGRQLRSLGGNFLGVQMCVKDSENRAMGVCFSVLRVAENKEKCNGPRKAII